MSRETFHQVFFDLSTNTLATEQLFPASEAHFFSCRFMTVMFFKT